MNPACLFPILFCLFDLGTVFPLREEAHLKRFGFKLWGAPPGWSLSCATQAHLTPSAQEGQRDLSGHFTLVHAGARESCFGVGAYMGVLMYKRVHICGCPHIYTCGSLHVHTHTWGFCIYTHAYVGVCLHTQAPCGGLPPPLCCKQPCDTGLRREAICFTRRS